MSALLLSAVIASILQVPAPSEGSSDGGSRGDRLVRTELFADRVAFRPGDTITLGVQLSVDPGWHVYWENPGDSGYPTKISIQAPPGFEVGPVRFPGPEREEAEGDIVTFIHSGKPVFLVDVRVPAEAASSLPSGSTATFEASARWLVCKDVCFPGSGSARIAIPLAPAGAEPARANDALFTAARAHVPRPWKDLSSATVEWSGNEDAPRLLVRVPRAKDLELFLRSSESTSLASCTVVKDEQGSSLTAALEFERKAPEDQPQARGVLHVRTESGAAYYDLDATFARRTSEPREKN